jgi:hypothetical protein
LFLKVIKKTQLHAGIVLILFLRRYYPGQVLRVKELYSSLSLVAPPVKINILY